LVIYIIVSGMHGHKEALHDDPSSLLSKCMVRNARNSL